ncbi:uvrD_C_2 domain-containing protein [Trichonephila clavipes]|nr:uvrD_C_2 domain-containing protein [Trichonephila clavipes]
MRQENRQFSEILTKIGDGNILTEEELKVMESRFITKEEAQSVCPEGIRLLFTNAAVNAYNYSVLNSVDDKIISVASDVITGCHNPEQENFVRQKLHKMKTDETGGLPYELILVLNRPYMITNNIDVADGLSNGTVGKLYHVERDENGDIIRIWLKFPKSCGRKQATKLRNLSARLNLDDDAVPITSQTSSVALNNNKTIIAKRKHFPLVSALAMTIHKSQGEKGSKFPIFVRGGKTARAGPALRQVKSELRNASSIQRRAIIVSTIWRPQATGAPTCVTTILLSGFSY